MSLTGFVFAFAGALAAKVRPAPADRQRLTRREELAGAQLLNEVMLDCDAAHWALETALGELGATREALSQVRSERDALRAELGAWLMAQQNAQMAQAQQMAQYQGQQNVYQSGMFQGLSQAQGVRQFDRRIDRDCTCVPGRAAALGGGPIGVG